MLRRLSAVFIALLPFGSLAQAQITFEALQGTKWGTALSIQEGQTPRFRWKWDGRVRPTIARYHISYSQTTPGGMLVAQVNLSIPGRLGDYGEFVIPPASMPSTPYDIKVFHVRVQAGPSLTQLASSAWITVTYSTVRKADNSRTIAAAPPPPPPFVIPGGDSKTLVTAGVTDPTNPPLRIRLTRITCNEETADGSPSDEVYAMTVGINLNWVRMASSPVMVTMSQVYGGMDQGDYRAPNLQVWGSPTAARTVKPGSAHPITELRDAVVYVTLIERDKANLWESFDELLATKATEILRTLSEKLSYDEATRFIGGELSKRVREFTGHEGLAVSGDDIIGLITPVPITAADLSAAKAGQTVKKSMTMSYPDREGRYTLDFEISK